MARRRSAPVADVASDDASLAWVASCVNDPLGFVEGGFPWGVKGTLLEDESGPDEWQRELLTDLGDALEARARAASGGDAAAIAAAQEQVDGALRFAVGSGHGVGKTTIVAWLVLWFISTRPNPQIIVTANTNAQLTGKTWRELAKWTRLLRVGSWFQWSVQKLALKAAPDTWYASAVPWSKERAEAFAGTHEKHVLLIFDEASAIEDVIWEVAEGAMTTTGAMWFVFGNGTRNTGRFRECFRRFKHRWRTRTVDSRQAKKADQKQIAQWAEDYGEDSDFFRVRVRGDFPSQAVSQFIAENVVEDARARYRSLMRRKREALGELAEQGAVVRLSLDADAPKWAPLIMSVDVARFGDDETVIGLRRGNLFLIHEKLKNRDTQFVAAKVAEAINMLGPDAVFVDANGIGGGVVDRLVALGYRVESVLGSLAPLEPAKFFNRRTEMWSLMKDWLKGGGIIEESMSLRDQLIAPEYGFDGKSRIQLETKDDLKSRGLPSPDEADCLAMTFFMPVAPKETAMESLLAKLGRKASDGTSHMAH